MTSLVLCHGQRLPLRQDKEVWSLKNPRLRKNQDQKNFSCVCLPKNVHSCPLKNDDVIIWPLDRLGDEMQETAEAREINLLESQIGYISAVGKSRFWEI